MIRTNFILLAFLSIAPLFCNQQKYTEAQLNALSEDLVDKFNMLPTIGHGLQCANPTPDRDNNLFYTYVIDLKTTLAKYHYQDPEGILIKAGYTFYNAWKKSSVGGYKCHEYLQCTPPTDLAHRQQNGWVIIYTCSCGPIRIVNGSLTKIYPSKWEPTQSKCQYTEPNSICSGDHSLCKEPDYVCLIDEFDVRCNTHFQSVLQDYLNLHSLERRKGDCQCRPKSEELLSWPTSQPWSTREYILKLNETNETPKIFQNFGQPCANVTDVIEKLRASFHLTTTNYRLNRAAKKEFDRMRASKDVSECDANKELSCDIPLGSPNSPPSPDSAMRPIIGKCKCNEIPIQSGWFADLKNPVNADGHCALLSNSDCSPHQNGFGCQEPDKCLVVQYSLPCSEKNLEDAIKKWEELEKPIGGESKKDETAVPEERYVKRCHCTNTTDIYEDLKDRAVKIGKPQKKKPIFDLGYGISNGRRSIGRMFIVYFELVIISVIYNY